MELSKKVWQSHYFLPIFHLHYHPPYMPDPWNLVSLGSFPFSHMSFPRKWESTFVIYFFSNVGAWFIKSVKSLFYNIFSINIDFFKNIFSKKKEFWNLCRIEYLQQKIKKIIYKTFFANYVNCFTKYNILYRYIKYYIKFY